MCKEVLEHKSPCLDKFWKIIIIGYAGFPLGAIFSVFVNFEDFSRLIIGMKLDLT